MKVTMKSVDKLVTLPGNRNINESHVRRLKKAMQRDNLLHLRPVLVTGKDVIIDGQHRVEAARQLGITMVPCLVLERPVPMEHIQAINLHTKGWTLMDYAKSYASQGKQDYVTFITFVEKHNIIPSFALVLLSKTDDWDIFRRGDLKAHKITDAETFMLKLNDFEQHFRYYKSFRFMAAFQVLYDTAGYDHAMLIHKLEMHRLKKCVSVAEYLVQFNMVYNYATKEEKRLTFSSIKK